MQVEHVFPRASQLTDPSVANVDFALLVFALANPPVSSLHCPELYAALVLCSFVLMD